MKFTVSSIFFLLLSAITFAQTRDLLTLPAYDCSHGKVMAIISRQKIIVSPDKNIGLETIILKLTIQFAEYL
jgi:hypothetical protein